MNKVICSIYRSSKKEEMYLYVHKKDELKQVPEALLNLFGTPVHVMSMLLDESKKLSRADTSEVLAALEEKGFFLQMPPPADDEMAELAQKNSKLQR